MEITLEFITGQDKEGNDVTINKTFQSDAKGRMVRKAIGLSSEINFDNLSQPDLDKLVGFVTELYRNKFTVDEFYDGIESDLLLSTLLESYQGVINGVTSRLATFPQE